MSTSVVTLDVCDDIRSGRHPFSRIMQAVAGLKPTQQLLLVAPFEPVPLYSLLSQQGFTHCATATPDGGYEIRFTRSDSPAPTRPVPGVAAHPPARLSDGASRLTVEVDARGMEPPQPLVTILEALANLPSGAALRAHTDRRPLHLFPQLEERGFAGQTAEQSDGSFVTLISRRQA